MQVSYTELIKTIDVVWHNGRSPKTENLKITLGPRSKGNGILLTEESCTAENFSMLAARSESVPSLLILPKSKAERAHQILGEAVCILAVRNSVDALYALAKQARAMNSATVVAVTGSVGKTTTISVFAQVLSTLKKVYSDENNRNLLAMTAACMLECKNSDDIALYEVAAMPNGMVRASQLLRPDLVVFTGTGDTHLEYMHSQLIVADVKAQLFFALGPNGTAVINRDDRFFHRVHEAAVEFGVGQIVTYGTHPSSSVRLLRYRVHEHGTSVFVNAFGRRLEIEINQQGRHWAMIAMSVLATAPTLDVELTNLIPHFTNLRPANRRGERHRINVKGMDITVINDSFNSNPTSMINAVTTLCEIPVTKGGRRLLVLGDMLALGDAAAVQHTMLAECINKSAVDSVLCFGEWMGTLHEHLTRDKRGGHFINRDAMEVALLSGLQQNDLILVKGSRGMALDKTVDALVRG